MISRPERGCKALTTNDLVPGRTPLMAGSEELVAFGEAVHRPAPNPIGIEEGGYIAPGLRSAHFNSGRKEIGHHERQGEEAGSSAGPREGSRPAAPAAGAAAHTLRAVVPNHLRVDELLAYHPSARLAGSSVGFVLISMQVGVFRSLPYRACLTLEVPTTASWAARWYGRTSMCPVPTIRAWARWDIGLRVMSHHMYPDRSICAYMLGQWQWGRDPIHALAESCMNWIAKSLFTQLYGHWPGPQHCGSHVRWTRRDKLEFCGCGSPYKYLECCASADRALSPHERWLEFVRAEKSYLTALAEQHRPSWPQLLPQGHCA